MEYDKIIEMVKEVSNLGLTSFDYTEGDVHISMNFPTAQQTEIPSCGNFLCSSLRGQRSLCKGGRFGEEGSDPGNRGSHEIDE